MDIAVQRDYLPNHFNSGFFLARSNERSLEAFLIMFNITESLRDDQEAFNQVIHGNKVIGLEVVELPDNHFPCGRKYFEDFGIHFGEDIEKNQEAYMVHNNW